MASPLVVVSWTVPCTFLILFWPHGGLGLSAAGPWFARKGLCLSPSVLQLPARTGPDSARTASQNPGPVPKSLEGFLRRHTECEELRALRSPLLVTPSEQSFSPCRCSEGKISERPRFQGGIFQSFEPCSWQGMIENEQPL